MSNFLYLIILVIIILGLIGTTYYIFLSKVSNRKGKTEIKWKVAFNKIIQIEFESKHEDNTKK